ncbi:hypothetical protein CRENBAI_026298 [Crenichthys baileyi]|uniref:Uncharacterized protein n=1 Tax=Crenichthys baileyi TaxID=28760 RepID=A0AAV9R8L1_9TELE
MLLPSSCLRFSPPQNHTMTAGTSQTDQAQHAKELKKWVQQQDEMLRALYGEEVEILPSPLLLEEMEECFCETDWAAVTLEPGRNCSSSVCASSKPRRSHRKRSTPAAAAPAELGTPTAAPVEPPSPPPATAEFRLGSPPVLDDVVGGQSPPLWAVTQRPLWSPVIGATSNPGLGPGRTAVHQQRVHEGTLYGVCSPSVGSPSGPAPRALNTAGRVSRGGVARRFSTTLSWRSLHSPSRGCSRRQIFRATAGRRRVFRVFRATAAAAGSSEPRLVPEEPEGGLPPHPRHVPEKPWGGLPPLPHRVPEGPEGGLPLLPRLVPEEPEGGLPPLPRHVPEGPVGGLPLLPHHVPEWPVGGLPPLPRHVPEGPEGGLPPLPRHVPEEPMGGLPPLPRHVPKGPEGGLPPLPRHVPEGPVGGLPPLPRHVPEGPVGGLPLLPRHVPEEPEGRLPPLPCLVPEEPEGGLPPQPDPEHFLAFLWAVLTELKPDTHQDTPEPDTLTHQSLTRHSQSPGQTRHSLSPGQTRHSLSPGQTRHSLTQFLAGHPPCLADLQISCLGPSLCGPCLGPSRMPGPSVRCGSGHAAGPRFVSYSGHAAGLLDDCISAAGLLDTCISAAGLLDTCISAAGLLTACISVAGLLTARLSIAGLQDACILAAGLQDACIFVAGLLTACISVTAGLQDACIFVAGLLTACISVTAGLQDACCPPSG